MAAAGAGGRPPATPDVCSFRIEGSLSEKIATVGIVNWSTDLENVTEASVEFTLNDAAPDVINRGSGGKVDATTHRALLLGLKQNRTYTYRFVVKSGDTTCISADSTLTTGVWAGFGGSPTRTPMEPAAQARGFFVTSGGLPSEVGSSGSGSAIIFDSDGDVVWWSPDTAPLGCSKALLDWEGQNLWMVASNPNPQSTPANATLQSVGMDGTPGFSSIGGSDTAHHDIAVLPGGIVASILWVGITTKSDLVERSPDGTTRLVAHLDDSVFAGASHANAVLYHPADNTYTVSDLGARAFVKLTRQGEPLWQFSADCAGSVAPKCAVGELTGNHGHHLLNDGHFLFFNATGGSGTSTAYEYQLTETADSLTATQLWSYSSMDLHSSWLGDIQRLPNGNTVVAFSSMGVIHELSPSGELVQVVNGGSFGYVNFRETLYGPPLR